VRAGKPARIWGRVLGGYLPPSGVLVQLQYRVSGTPQGWEPFGQPVHSRANGLWALPINKWPPAGAGYTYLIRALIPAPQNGWPYTGAISNVVARYVLR
jgi:hypothetical protein